MLIAYWILLLLYVGLTILYIITKNKPFKIPPWPVIPTDVKDTNEIILLASCNDYTDCPPNYICLGNTCVPKLFQNDICDPTTGYWISYIYGGVTFAVCICTEPNLMNQMYFGGNCNVNVGCGVHGVYQPDKKKCRCDSGYTEVGLTCQKLPTIQKHWPCEFDEIQVDRINPSHGFHPEYVRRLTESGARCVKRPCLFDALTGRPLKRARFEPEWGCVCDPRFGLFGVLFDNKNYLSTPGYDACTSIFKEEPQNPINVKLITYFYLGQRKPVSLILFENLTNDKLIPILRGNENHFIIGQQLWRYDYAQYFFKTNLVFRARTRSINTVYPFNIEFINKYHYINDFIPSKCDEIGNLLYDYTNEKKHIYELLYNNPVCIETNNPNFKDKVIVNPHHLTYKSSLDLPHFNAFVLDYDSNVAYGRWTLDLDYPYKIDFYLSTQTNAPLYNLNIKDKKFVIGRTGFSEDTWI